MPAGGAIVREEFRERVRARRQQVGCCWPGELREPCEAHMRALIAPALLGVRVPLDGLGWILIDGRFQTRYELGEQASKNPPRTPAQEAQVWAVCESALGEMPVYGYLATRADAASLLTRASLHQAYGSARVLLTDAVRPRATVFFGDSRWAITHEEGAPAPLDRPDELSWLPDRGDPRARASVDDGVFDEVIEAQVIGGIHASEIEQAIFDYPPPALMEQALCSRHIDWAVNPMPDTARLPAPFVRDQLTAEARTSLGEWLSVHACGVDAGCGGDGH
jgi:hypothetical protein